MFLWWWVGAGIAVAPAPTPAAVVAETSDAHSWFSFAPALLSYPASTPLKGEWRASLPVPVATFTVTVHPVPIRPVPVITPWVVTLPAPLPPARLHGAIRVAMPGARATWTISVGDADEAYLMLVAELMSQPPKAYLMDRRVLEDEWFSVLAGMLS